MSKPPISCRNTKRRSLHWNAWSAGKVFSFEAFQTSWNRTDSTHQVCRFSCGVTKNSAGAVTLIKATVVIASDGSEKQVTFAAADTND